MLGPEGWKPTAAEAAEAGFVAQVVPHEKLMPAAQALGEKWAQEGRVRSLLEKGLVEEYKGVNDRESRELADAFLSYKFLNAQYEFLNSKGKAGTARAFWWIKTLRPAWSMLL